MAGERTVGFVHNPRSEARALAEALMKHLPPSWEGWVCSVQEVEAHREPLARSALLVTIGGDGTILRTVRVAAPLGVPIVGVNLGHLGFMTEMPAEEAGDRLGLYLDGEGVWLEERNMLQAEVLEGGRESSPTALPLHGLNDAVVSRGAVARLIRVEAWVNGARLTTYRADAVLVSTATGSTGYNLSAGGPILHPLSGEMVLKPVAAHLGLTTALVLPPDSLVELVVGPGPEALLSVDGFQDRVLTQGQAVRVRQSPFKARFLRLRPRNYFYTMLARRLGLDGLMGR